MMKKIKLNRRKKNYVVTTKIEKNEKDLNSTIQKHCSQNSKADLIKNNNYFQPNRILLTQI